mmetsp:Transcript_18231/g.37126  ORF Transcript_18231/g.37126 Transcript_18231/m.37126 type:complete len:225 (+) Transcript_18231:26-700(+)
MIGSISTPPSTPIAGLVLKPTTYIGKTSPISRGIEPTRWHIDSSTLALLEKVFAFEQFPNMETRKQLGDELGVSPRQIQVWFQNRRQRERKNRSSPTDSCTQSRPDSGAPGRTVALGPDESPPATIPDPHGAGVSPVPPSMQTQPQPQPRPLSQRPPPPPPQRPPQQRPQPAPQSSKPASVDAKGFDALHLLLHFSGTAATRVLEPPHPPLPRPTATGGRLSSS